MSAKEALQLSLRPKPQLIHCLIHWQIQRKNLVPAFSFRHIKDLYPSSGTRASRWCS